MTVGLILLILAAPVQIQAQQMNGRLHYDAVIEIRSSGFPNPQNPCGPGWLQAAEHRDCGVCG